MNKIVKIAIVMAIMMSATFAFGQSTTGVSNPNGGTSVMLILNNPYDVWNYDITYRWKDGSGNWGTWNPMTKSASGGLQTEVGFWTSWDATEFEYQVTAKKQNGVAIAGTQGLFLINNHGVTIHAHWLWMTNPF